MKLRHGYKDTRTPSQTTMGPRVDMGVSETKTEVETKTLDFDNKDTDGGSRLTKWSTTGD